MRIKKITISVDKVKNLCYTVSVRRGVLTDMGEIITAKEIENSEKLAENVKLCFSSLKDICVAHEAARLSMADKYLRIITEPDVPDKMRKSALKAVNKNAWKGNPYVMALGVGTVMSAAAATLIAYELYRRRNEKEPVAA